VVLAQLYTAIYDKEKSLGMPPIKTYYIIREPKICVVRDICIHIVFDSAIAAFERIIQKITAIGDIELWAVATDQTGYVSTEWLVYSYVRTANRITKHADAGLKGSTREPAIPSTPRLSVMDGSGAVWEEIPEFDFSITY
jgi:hypothetical protein